jgi:Na+/proline symporter
MQRGWVIVLAALAYMATLFAIAHYGDRVKVRFLRSGGRPLIYALSLGVYCTSWTFFGSVGMASTHGLEFLTIYIGPALVYLIGYPILRRVARLTTAERITSVADFMAARYGKSETVAAVVTAIAFIGIVPYIALQLKAVSTEVTTLMAHYAALSGAAPGNIAGLGLDIDIALPIALGLAVFACLFGTRRLDAGEHQEGLMLAIAAESVVKVVSLSLVGLFVVDDVFGGTWPMLAAIMAPDQGHGMFANEASGGSWLVMTGLSFGAIVLLPHMFHVTFVEHTSAAELKRARWLFPLYLLAINLFVVPIALGGLMRFGADGNADMFVLRLPLEANQPVITIIAFLGGLSAATAMVIVASVALALMVSNEIVVPLILRGRRPEEPEPQNFGNHLLWVRRAVIFAILLVAYLYYRTVAEGPGLAEIGLVAFAAMAQLAPAFFGGLIWRDATARGAIAGMTIGFICRRSSIQGSCRDRSLMQVRSASGCCARALYSRSRSIRSSTACSGACSAMSRRS